MGLATGFIDFDVKAVRGITCDFEKLRASRTGDSCLCKKIVEKNLKKAYSPLTPANVAKMVAASFIFLFYLDVYPICGEK